MGKPFTLAGAAVNNTDTSAAFQLATWEVVNEPATELNLSGGVFRLEQGGCTVQPQLANGWLSAVLAPTAKRTFNATHLYSRVAQDFVVFNTAPLPDTAGKLPEPGNLALSGLALMALLATKACRLAERWFQLAPGPRLSETVNGRGERIRTFDPLVPNQMRYQAALRPD